VLVAAQDPASPDRPRRARGQVQARQRHLPVPEPPLDGGPGHVRRRVPAGASPTTN